VVWWLGLQNMDLNVANIPKHNSCFSDCEIRSDILRIDNAAKAFGGQFLPGLTPGVYSAPSALVGFQERVGVEQGGTAAERRKGRCSGVGKERQYGWKEMAPSTSLSDRQTPV